MLGIGVLYLERLYLLAVYEGVYKFVLAKRYGIDQTKLRRYVVGCILFSLVGIPTFVSQAKTDKQQDEVKSAIATILGKADGACQAAIYTRRRYCSSFVISEDLQNACSTNLADIVPGTLKAEVDTLFSSERHKSEVLLLQRQVDNGFETGRKASVSKEVVCKRYEEFVENVYQTAVTEIGSVKGTLR